MKIKRILVSQPQPDPTLPPFGKLAERTGVELVFRPFIHVEGVTSYEFRKQRIDLTKFPSVIFTSRTAVDHFFRLAEEIRYNVPETTRYFCNSENVALYLQKYTVYRKRKIFFPADGTMESLVKMMDKYKKERFLLPLADVHKPDVPKLLRKEGIRFTKVITHRTVSSDLSDVDISQFDLLVFYSPQGIKSLTENFPDFVQGDVSIAAFGATTHKAVKAAGLVLQVPVPTPTCKSMTEALEAYIGEQNGQSTT